MKKYEFIGKTKEEAIDIALDELKVKEKDLIIRDKEETKGGIFKSKKVTIEVIKKDDLIEIVKDSILNITKKMGLDTKIESKMRDDILNITLYSDNNNNILIGRNGRTINALSIIIKQMIQNEVGNNFKFNLDVADYKVKQQKRIENLARKTAREVAKTKIDAKLDPMNSYERRIIHNILNDDKYVYTESEGEEPERYVVIRCRETK